MKCINCGNELPEDARFCFMCGAKQPEQEMVPESIEEPEQETEPEKTEEPEQETAPGETEEPEQETTPGKTEEPEQETVTEKTEEPEQKTIPGKAEEAEQEIVTEKTGEPEQEAEPERREDEAMQESGGMSYKFCPYCGSKNDEDAVYCCSCGNNMNMEFSGTDSVVPKKKKTGKRIAGVVAALAVIGAVAAGVSALTGGGDNAFVAYLKDGKVNQVDLDHYKKEPVEYSGTYSIDSDYSEYGLVVQYSKDGKYIFYPTKVEYGSDGVEYRLNMQKSEKGGEAVKIDNSVTTYTVLDDNRVIYIKGGSRTLYIYDKKGNKEKIASDVGYYRLDSEQKNVVWTEGESGGKKEIFQQDLNLKKEKKTLAKDAEMIYIGKDLKQIAVMEEDVLYLIQDFKEKEKISSGVSDVILNNEKDNCIYYTKEEENTLTASDLVEDDCAETDADITKPEYEDFTEEKIEKNSLTGKYEKVEVIDYDAYDEAYDRYAEKENRDTMRDNLKNHEISSQVNQLYCYKDGKEVKIDDTFAAYSYYSGTEQILYNHYNMDEIPKLKLSNLSHIDEVETEYYQSLQDSLETCVYTGGKTVVLDETLSNYIMVDEENKIGYGIKDTEGTLLSFSVDSKSKGKCEVVAEDVSSVEAVKEGKIYYLTDVEDDAGELYCDGKHIDSDVYPNSLEFVDGSAVYAVDYDTSKGRATLKMYDGKDDETIANDVFSYIALDKKKIAVLMDYSLENHRGDLKLYRGKEELEDIDEDVNFIFDGRTFHY